VAQLYLDILLKLFQIEQEVIQNLFLVRSVVFYILIVPMSFSIEKHLPRRQRWRPA
jgi:hypothetical protein